MIMQIKLSRVVVASLLLAATMTPALADGPSRQDIIDALSSKDTGVSRGFSQVPGFAAGAKPPSAAASAGYAKPEPVAAQHASLGVPILFDLDSAVIKPESRSTLDAIVGALKSPQLASAKILLEGHTDGLGSAEHNQGLSLDRANAVKSFLVTEGGIPSDRLSTVGKGESEPVDPTKPLAPENRRVVLVNLSN